MNDATGICLEQTQPHHLPRHQTALPMLVRYSKEPNGQMWAKTHGFVSDNLNAPQIVFSTVALKTS